MILFIRLKLKYVLIIINIDFEKSKAFDAYIFNDITNKLYCYKQIKKRIVIGYDYYCYDNYIPFVSSPTNGHQLPFYTETEYLNYIKCHLTKRKAGWGGDVCKYKVSI